MTPYQKKQRARAAAKEAKKVKGPRLTGPALLAVRDRLMVANNGGPVAGPAERAEITRLVAVNLARRGGLLHEAGQARQMLDVVLEAREQKRAARAAAKEARAPLSDLQATIDRIALKRLDSVVKVREAPMPSKGGVSVQMPEIKVEIPEAK